MHQPTHYSPVAQAYARALLELAEERQPNSAAEVGRELNDLRALVEADPAFGLYLSDPSVSPEQRGGVLDRALKGKVSPLLYDFVRVLNHKGRLRFLPQIAGAYQEMLDEKLGKVEVDLIVAQKLEQSQVEEARQRISAALKRDAVVHVYVDDKIIGGAVLRVGDKLIDASVKYQLQLMKEKLLAQAPR
jgi:F-type H+-transporting ATPase subunit delta